MVTADCREKQRKETFGEIEHGNMLLLLWLISAYKAQGMRAEPPTPQGKGGKVDRPGARAAAIRAMVGQTPNLED